MPKSVGGWAFKAGAVFYVLWGLLHLYAAFLSFQLGGEQEFGLVQSKLYQNGWNLAAISTACIAVAAMLNWRNSRLGFWINAIMVSVTDIGFIVLVLIPGVSNDVLGPILWLLGLAGTGYGYFRAERTP